MLGDKCECLIWCHGKVNGKFIRQSLDTRGLAMAEMKKRDLLNPPPPDPSSGGRPRLVGSHVTEDGKANVTVTDAAAQFMRDQEDKAPKTRENYGRAVREFSAFAAAHETVLLRHVTPDLIKAYFRENSTRWNQRSKVGRLDDLRTFFNYGVSREWLVISPAARQKDPTYYKRTFKRTTADLRKPFTHDQLKKIFAAIERMPEPKRTTARALITLMLSSGMRVSDATFAERSAIDKRGMLNYTSIKTKHALKLPIWLRKEAIKALAALPPSRIYFFQPDRDDDYWDARHLLMTGQDGFSQAFPGGRRAYDIQVRAMKLLVMDVLRRAGLRKSEKEEADANRNRKRAGYEGACHRFRDTFAVGLLTEDVDIYTVSQFLGHSDVKITGDHYLKLVEGYMDKMSKKTAAINYPLAG
jgi:site-specific recombinase XerD